MGGSRVRGRSVQCVAHGAGLAPFLGGRNVRRAGAVMSACNRCDAEQPGLVSRQAALEPRTIRITIELYNSDKLDVASYRLSTTGATYLVQRCVSNLR